MENYTGQTTQFTNHSGGAVGSDEYWGEVGKKHGVVSRHYWHGKQTPHGNTEISEEDFQEGVSKVMLANETLHRKPDKYMDLLARNWCQVKNCDEVFAIGHIKNGIVDGGTGWAVQMAIDAGKTVNLYDQYRKQWFIHDTDGWRFLESAPTLTKNFAGIGTRDINSYGKAAIDEVYRNTFQEPCQKQSTTLYKITEKHVYCELRCSGHGNIFNCIECKEARDIVEETRTMTQQQYIDLLKEGNTFITKVETAYDTNKKISNDVKN